METSRDSIIGRGARGATELAARIREVSHPLRGSEDFDPLMDRIGDASYVLLGEVSHGTQEYYFS